MLLQPFSATTAGQPKECRERMPPKLRLMWRPASTFPVRCSADKDKSSEDRQKEEELLQQIQKLVETRDFLVDDVEFERLRCVWWWTSCLCSFITAQLELAAVTVGWIWIIKVWGKERGWKERVTLQRNTHTVSRKSSSDSLTQSFVHGCTFCPPLEAVFEAFCYLFRMLRETCVFQSKYLTYWIFN